jgi:hypothetical protein
VGDRTLLAEDVSLFRWILFQVVEFFSGGSNVVISLGLDTEEGV